MENCVNGLAALAEKRVIAERTNVKTTPSKFFQSDLMKSKQKDSSSLLNVRLELLNITFTDHLKINYPLESKYVGILKKIKQLKKKIELTTNDFSLVKQISHRQELVTLNKIYHQQAIEYAVEISHVIPKWDSLEKVINISISTSDTVDQDVLHLLKTFDIYRAGFQLGNSYYTNLNNHLPIKQLRFRQWDVEIGGNISVLQNTCRYIDNFNGLRRLTSDELAEYDIFCSSSVSDFIDKLILTQTDEYPLIAFKINVDLLHDDVKLQQKVEGIKKIFKNKGIQLEDDSWYDPFCEDPFIFAFENIDEQDLKDIKVAIHEFIQPLVSEEANSVATGSLLSRG